MSQPQQSARGSASKPNPLSATPSRRGPGRPRKKSLYHGVSRNEGNNSRPWLARVTVNGETRYLGSFALEEEAATAVDEAIIKYKLNPKHINFPSPTNTASSATSPAATMTTSPSSGSSSDIEDDDEDPYAAIRPKTYVQELPPLHELLASPTMQKAFPTATSVPPPPPSPRLVMNNNKRSFSVGGPGSGGGGGAQGTNLEEIRQKTIGALWRTSSSPSFQQDEGIKKQVRKAMRAVQNGEADSLLAGIFMYGGYKEDQYPELAIMLLTEFGVSSGGKSS